MAKSPMLLLTGFWETGDFLQHRIMASRWVWLLNSGKWRFDLWTVAAGKGRSVDPRLSHTVDRAQQVTRLRCF